MPVNCSITHTLNKSATDEELNALLKLANSQLLAPNQRKSIQVFVGRKSIDNSLVQTEGREQTSNNG
ncbi:hypothetical protein [Vibrio mediterranei]|uniref:Uncharacterized protein n=1 Tax=Vibrio mediterranei TaxID=689 RepID=A0ABX5D4I3_9VIBR|nr:hypothetical protein [Vibrio mediterranei]PCD85867.1 hypothetical protein COR52_24085 [Vibrio mediterranei]PRQ64489.1 hypothetical protein COR51_27245 [Vibrio mediterranei]